jgi:hypothetical protein
MRNGNSYQFFVANRQDVHEAKCELNALIKGRLRQSMSQEILHALNVSLSAICPCCGTRLTNPEWSQCLSGGKTADLWCGQICRSAFLTTNSAVEKARSGDAIAPLKIHRILAGRYTDVF